MYLAFYKLSKDPFRMTPQTSPVFLSATQHAAWSALTEGFELRSGLMVITGQVGLGKTTVLQSYLQHIEPEHPRVIHVPNANFYLSFKQLIKTMLSAWGEEEFTENLADLLEQLRGALLNDHYQGRAVILCIDEAQNLPLVTLKHLTELSNMETGTDKLVQIVLVGQPELIELLKRAELYQFTQRIERYETLKTLTLKESISYIDHRLDDAGAQRNAIFSEVAANHLIQAAQGVPRVLNRLCANALVQGARQRERPISAKIVKDVIREWRDQSVAASFSRRTVYVAGAAAVLVLGLLWFALPKLAVTAKAPAVTSESDVEGVAESGPARWAEHALDTVPASEALVQKLLGREAQTAFPLTVVVGPDEDLPSIARHIYGFVDKTLIAAILQHNPHLPNLDAIEAGQKLILPAYSASLPPADRR